MSVIITGMDMPNTCHKCKYSKCYFYGKAWQTIDGTKDYRSNRDKTCPLKSIKGLIKKIEQEIDDNPYASLGEYRAGLYKGIEIIKEYCEEEQEE